MQKVVYEPSTAAGPGDNAEQVIAQANTAQKAISALYAESLDQLTAGLRKRYGDGPPEPEDIAHQAFQKLMEQTDLSRVRNLKAFLWGTAKNLMLNGKRDIAVAGRYESDVAAEFFSTNSHTSDPQRVIDATEQIRLVNEALKTMPDRRRRAYYLRRVEGLGVKEIAQRLHISHSAVSRHVSSALAQIDAFLQDQGA